MSRGGTARNSKKTSKLTPKPTAKVLVLPDAELLKQIKKAEKDNKALAALSRRCVVYLEKELKKALGEEGNDVKVQRLLKGIEERRRSTGELEATLRRSRQAGLAPASAGGPKDFARLMATKRAKA